MARLVQAARAGGASGALGGRSKAAQPVAYPARRRRLTPGRCFEESFDQGDSTVIGPDLEWTKGDTSQIGGVPEIGFDDGETYSGAFAVYGGTGSTDISGRGSIRADHRVATPSQSVAARVPAISPYTPDPPPLTPPPASGNQLRTFGLGLRLGAEITAGANKGRFVGYYATFSGDGDPLAWTVTFTGVRPNGSTATLSSSPSITPLAVDDDLRFAASGRRLRAYVNDVLVYEVTHSAAGSPPPTTGRMGGLVITVLHGVTGTNSIDPHVDRLDDFRICDL